MFCVSCGAQMAAGSRFCASCGHAASMAPMSSAAFAAPIHGQSSDDGWVLNAYAGFWKRAAAAVIDGVILWAGAIVLFFINDSLFFLGAIIGGWLYFVLQESSEHQATLGKRALGIVVVDEHGERISFGRATGRFFAKWLSNVTFYVGYIIAGFTAKKQALHDLVASTLVVNRS